MVQCDSLWSMTVLLTRKPGNSEFLLTFFRYLLKLRLSFILSQPLQTFS
ncbi:hypothetical protein CA11_27080 [Gimesia maris]|nr:hypothetical protein CA11_27080 [Gimesia maris]